jgi:hypothetical protein
MQQIDTRMNNLRDLLHHEGLPPLTIATSGDSKAITEPKITQRIMHLHGTITPFDPDKDHTQLLPSFGETITKTMMYKLKHTATNIIWQLPLRKSQQITVTMLNRLVPTKSKNRLVNVTLRVLDNWNGRPRRADVKCVVDDHAGQKRIYFGR